MTDHRHVSFSQLKELLIQHGYRQVPNHGGLFSATALFQKEFESATKCACNDKNFFDIFVHDMADVGTRSTVTVEVCGEVEKPNSTDGCWFKLKGYGIFWEDVSRQLAKVEKALVAAWEASASSFMDVT